ncbi:MAG: hypothetical protein JSS44_05900 [Proteobacteria bacterium]|nr:hypothetical protein [Pseudomonadota bacterium]MBS0463375.1 hypothetical protein [Pseudomonadota bacterium]
MSLFLAGLLALTSGSAAAAPVVADPAATTAQAADQAAYQAAMRELVRTLRDSASPRDRALASQLLPVVPATDGSEPASAEQAASGKLLRAAAQAAPDDALVQALWVNADPRLSGCDVKNPCPRRADALARLQPDNAAAWVPLVDAAWQRKDTAGIDAALAKMAKARDYDDFLGQALKAWMDVYARHPLPVPTSDPAAARFSPRATALVAAMGMASATALSPFDKVVKSCQRQMNPDAPPSRFRDCAQIGRTLLVHGDSLLGRMIGRGLLRVSGQATPADVEPARNAQWQQENWMRLTATADPARLDAAAADWANASNEMAVLQIQFQRAGIALTPPAGWMAHNSRGEPVPPLGEVAPGSGKLEPNRR